MQQQVDCSWTLHRIETDINHSIAGPIPNFIKTATPICRPGSDDAFNRIKDWISTCSRHIDCRSLSGASLPKRVIDVITAAPDVVLVNSNSEAGQYTCLSHPWGKEVPLMTKISTLNPHLNRISFDELPPTFQDAVKITRHIGIRWIWIDALCIIQDDSLDWERESSDVATIYSNSYLTIAATSSARPSDGCFRRIEVPKHSLVRSPTTMNLLEGFYFREQVGPQHQGF